MEQESTGIIAIIGIAISLTGGIPGIISIIEYSNQRPKLEIIYKHRFSGGAQFGPPVNRHESFIAIVFSIGNRGKSIFQWFRVPEAMIQVNKKWIKLKVMGLSGVSLDSFADGMKTQFPINSHVLDLIKKREIPDYY